MTEVVGSVFAVRLHGAWADRSLDYEAELQLTPLEVRITFDSAAPKHIVVPLAELTGAVLHADVLTLFWGPAGSVSVSRSPHLVGLARRIEAAVCVFPAQLLSLRSFGSESSAPGSDHDRWFEALLTARRVAEETRTIETQRRAFDAARLLRHAELTRESWAAERCEQPADQRALRAELEELAAGYTAAVEALDLAALSLRKSAETSTEYTEWRQWTEAVHACFVAADAAWSASLPALADSRGAAGSLWRRVLRRSR
jgi:hypothetical protein